MALDDIRKNATFVVKQVVSDEDICNDMKVTIAELRFLVRERLLSEAMKSQDDCVNDGMALMKTPQLVTLYRLPNPAMSLALENQILLSVVGSIRLSSLRKWEDIQYREVKGSIAEKGYGPVVYDAALSSGEWIAPDSTDVSDAAAKIWKTYYDARPDVERVKLKQPESSPFSKMIRHHLFYAYRLTSPVIGPAERVHANAPEKFGVDAGVWNEWVRHAGRMRLPR